SDKETCRVRKILAWPDRNLSRQDWAHEKAAGLPRWPAILVRSGRTNTVCDARYSYLIADFQKPVFEHASDCRNAQCAQDARDSADSRTGLHGQRLVSASRNSRHTRERKII